MSETKSLAKKYIKYMDEGFPHGDTWDDFFDHVKVPTEHRSNFAVAAILKQSLELINEGGY